MKSLVDLLEHLLHDCGRKSGANVLRDVETLRSRVKHEGDSFITITLPNFCRDFERSLDQGRIVPGSFASFGKLRSGIPEFLRGFLHNVFGQDGCLRESPSIDCIRSVRQLCLFGKKIQRPCSKERELDAVAAYKACEDEIGSDYAEPGKLRTYFRRVAALLCGSLYLTDPQILEDLVPKHGPGATQERIMGNQKWRFRRWHYRLVRAGFTFGKYGQAQTDWMGLEDMDQWPRFVEPADEDPVRVVFVPKTLKSPRVIAVEPVCMQFAQQALKQVLVNRLERGYFSAGHINFKAQQRNQNLARLGSQSGQYATIDLSEASDRVSVSHVESLLASCPGFLRLVMAARSTCAELPTGERITLKKFASMGSALTFPLESMVFFTAIIASRLARAGNYPTARNVHASGRDVWVYGDDLIVPADEASAVCEDLEALGFKVNHSKSFWTGKFRESCGVDAYAGVEITPVYLRRDCPASRADVPGILSIVSTADQLWKAGYFETSTALRKAVERIVGPLPAVREDSPALGWRNHYSEVVARRRWNKALQREEIRVLVPFSPEDPDPLDGDGALAKCYRIMQGRRPVHELLPHVEESSSSPEHLECSVTPYGVTLTRRWVPLN